MTQAWIDARDLHEYNPEKYPTVKSAFAVTLKRGWSRARVAMERSIQQEKSNAMSLRLGNRYLECLDVAEAEGLNHGKAWMQDKMAARFGGKMVCYVYPR